MTEEQHIQNGFNAGYQLQQHDPELVTTITQGFADKNHPYAKGFDAGAKEWVKEHAAEASLEKDAYLKELKQEAKDQLKAKELEDPDLNLGL